MVEWLLLCFEIEGNDYNKIASLLVLCFQICKVILYTLKPVFNIVVDRFKKF